MIRHWFVPPARRKFKINRDVAWLWSVLVAKWGHEYQWEEDPNE